MAVNANLGELVASIVVNTEPAVRNLQQFAKQLGLTEEQIGSMITSSETLQKEFAKTAAAVSKVAVPSQPAGTKPPVPVPPAGAATAVSPPQELEPVTESVERYAQTLGLTSTELQRMIDSQEKLMVQATMGGGTIEGLKAKLTLLKQELASLVVGSEEYKKKLAEVHHVENELREVTLAGKDAVRAFRQEQRLQHFVLRESLHTITNTAFALTFLTSGFGEAKESSHALEKSLLTGVVALDTAEFSLFGLTRAAERLPGRFGAIAASIGAMAGPIGIAIGAVAALSAYLVTLGEEDAKRAEEGMKKFLDVLKTGSVEQQEKAIQAMQDELKGLQDRLASIQPKEVTTQVFRGEKVETKIFSETDQEKIKVLEEAIERLTNRIKKAKEQLSELRAGKAEEAAATSLLELHATELQRIQNELKKIDELQQQGETRLENGVRIADRRRELEERRREITRSSLQEFADELNKMELRNKLGEVSLAAIERQLRRMLDIRDVNGKLVITTKEELEIRNKLNEVIERRKALELDVAKMQVENIREDTARAKREEDIRHEQNIIEIKKKYGAEEALRKKALDEEDKRHLQALADIEEQRAAHIADLRIKTIENETQRKLAELDEEQRRVEENLAARKITQEEADLRLLALTNERTRVEQNAAFELRRLRIETIEDEEERIRALGELQIEQILKSADAEEVKAARIAKARAEIERDLRNLQDKRIDRELQAIDRIGAALQRALGQAADDFINKLRDAANIALEIIRLARKAETSEGVDVLDILGTAATIFGLFADEGLVVPGKIGEPVPIIAHAGETVLPTHKYSLPVALARVQKQQSTQGVAPRLSFDEGGIVGGMVLNAAALMQKLDSLTEAVKALQMQEVRGKVSIDNGKLFLRRHISDAMKFHKNQTA